MPLPTVLYQNVEPANQKWMEIHVPCVKSEPIMPCTTFRFSKRLCPILKLNGYHILVLLIYAFSTFPVLSVLLMNIQHLNCSSFCSVLKFRVDLSLMENFFLTITALLLWYAYIFCVCINVEHSKHGNKFLYLYFQLISCLCNTLAH